VSVVTSKWLISLGISLVATIIFGISHGHTVAEKNDPMMELAERANDDFSKSALPGAYLCDALPICAFSFGPRAAWLVQRRYSLAVRYIPDWTGVRFKQDAKRFRETVELLRDGAYEDVKAKVVRFLKSEKLEI
jgi:hypothetical protein